MTDEEKKELQELHSRVAQRRENEKKTARKGDVYNEKFSKRQSYSKCVYDSKGY